MTSGGGPGDSREPGDRGDGELKPSEVRERILEEHDQLRRLLIDLDALAAAVLDGKAGLGARLRDKATEIYEVLRAHIDLEDRILAPALRETPGFGELRERRLLEHHAEQRKAFESAIAELRVGPPSPESLARRVREMVADVRMDMAHEDKDLLNPELLKDDPINVSFTG